MSQQLTKRQIQRLGKLPPDYRVVSAQRRPPLVRRPDGQRLLVQPNGRLSASPLVERVQSYLRVEGG
jgi:hypothetical protein